MPTRVSVTPEVEGPSSPASYETSSPKTASQTLAVRSSRGARSVSGSKRKRTDTTNGQPSNSRRRTVEPEQESDDAEESEEEDGDQEANTNIPEDQMAWDPDQPMHLRRKVQRQIRDLTKQVADNREEYLQKGSNLTEVVRKQNQYIKNVKRPGEAVADSRLLVGAADLGYQKALRLTHGSLAQGLDVDEFVSKCITYMRQGRGLEADDSLALSSAQRRRRSRRDGEEEEEDEGDMMNWPHLGRFAALPYGRRPALPGFLLGPLSVEKKARKITKRSAPFRPQNLTETRPEVLSASDFAGKKKESDMTAICASILRELDTVLDEAQRTVEQAIEGNDYSEEEAAQVMHNAGLRDTGGIDLLRFVVNPKSFGQTVENMFYVSFLIRDGKVAVEYDQHDYPSLRPFDKDGEDEESGRSGASKHQAVMSMDMETWQSIIDTLGLTSPMIAHREEMSNQGPGARGWYS